MRLGKYDIVLHCGNSIAADYVDNTKKVGFCRNDRDLVIKIGRNLLIVSDIDKIRKYGGGVSKARH